MKIYVRHNTGVPNEIVVGMSTTRSKLMRDLLARNPLLIQHLVKFYVYSDSESHNHWKQEIAGYLDYVNKKTLKNGKKLKPSDLKKTIFNDINQGDVSDAHSILRSFLLDNTTKEYPRFEITDELDRQFSKFLQLFLHETLQILSTKNNYSMQDFYPLLDMCVRKSNRSKIEYV